MSPPIIFMAFANDHDDSTRYLRELDAERKGIRKALEVLEKQNYIEVVEKVNVSLAEIFDVFQDERYQGRIVGFHYGGHADGFQLLLHDESGNKIIDGAGIIQLFADTSSLKFAFFNGCSTQEYAEKLKNTLPLVISSDNAIEDVVAKDLAIRFYKALAENMTLQRAFQQSQAFITSNHGRDTRALYRKNLENVPKKSPWFLSVNTQRRTELQRWTLKASETQQGEGESATDQVNQFLMLPLYEALGEIQPELLQRNEWKNKDLRRIKLHIIEAFPYPISINLRKLFANTAEITAFSEARLRQLLMTYQQTTQFILCILLSEIWEMQHRNGMLMMDMMVLEDLKNYLTQSPQNRQSETWTICQRVLEEFELAGEQIFVSELQTLLVQLQDENSQWTKAQQYLDNQSPEISAGEARTIIMETEKQLAVVLKHLAFLGTYKLQVVKNIMTQKVRMKPPEYEHNVLVFNHQNEDLNADERQREDYFLDSRSVILHQGQGAIPENDKFLNLTPFVMDANSFRNSVNAQLHYISKQINEEKWEFMAMDNMRTLEVTPTNEFFEIKSLLETFNQDCLTI